MDVSWCGTQHRWGMGTIFSGTIAVPKYLSDPASNPAVVSSGATLTNGIGGAATINWTLTNYGSILAGVNFHGGADVSNASSGFILGTVVNVGVYIAAAPALVTNSGTIRTGTVSGSGVYLKQGGTVINEVALDLTLGLVPGVIMGGAVGVRLGGDGSISNAGSIIANNTTAGAGIVLRPNGIVANQAGGLISGLVGILDNTGTATVVNDGSIAGGSIGTLQSYGMDLYIGSVTNSASGRISATRGGVVLRNGGTLVNAGLIASATTSGAGAFVNFASISNQSNGTISGGWGVYGVGLTLTNAGHVIGSHYGVHSFGGLVSNASSGTVAGGIAIANGTVINDGQLTGGGTLIAALSVSDNSALGNRTSQITNTTSGNINGTIGVQGTFSGATSIVNAGTIGGAASGGYGILLSSPAYVANQRTGTISAATGLYLKAGGTVSNAGTLHAAYGIRLAGGAGTVVNSGTIYAAAAALSDHTAIQFAPGQANRLVLVPGSYIHGSVDGGNTIGSGSGSSTLELAPGGTNHGTLTGLGVNVSNFTGIEFDAGAQWYIAGNSHGLGGVIAGFSLGDTIHISGVTASGFQYSSNDLTITQAAGSPAYLIFAAGGTLSTANFAVTNRSLGVDVAFVACFRRGTLIRGEFGERPIEQFAVGDRVLAHFAGIAEITWIGERRINCARHPEPWRVWPVRVRAGAFGPNLPSRDLWLSPDHAVFVRDVLIPVKLLIDGDSITQVPADEISYFHLELLRHDLVQAERLLAESFLDAAAFAAWPPASSVVTSRSPVFNARAEAEACAPLVLRGPELASIRAWLAARTVVPDGLVAVA